MGELRFGGAGRCKRRRNLCRDGLPPGKLTAFRESPTFFQLFTNFFQEVQMSEMTVVAVAVAAPAKPFACHGEPHPGKPGTAKLTQAEAWVPKLARIKKAIGRWPTLAKDLADHIYCGRCAAFARKAGVPFYRYPQTVVEMERRRVERTQAARQAFHRYL